MLTNYLYPSETTLDFILCFKYANQTGNSSFAYNYNEFTLASSGIISTVVVHYAEDSSVKVGYINYYYDSQVDSASAWTYNTGNRVPLLMRVMGEIGTEDCSDCNRLILFFD